MKFKSIIQATQAIKIQVTLKVLMTINLKNYYLMNRIRFKALKVT